MPFTQGHGRIETKYKETGNEYECKKCLTKIYLTRNQAQDLTRNKRKAEKSGNEYIGPLCYKCRRFNKRDPLDDYSLS